MTLEFVGINGASHPTTIVGYDKSFVLKRGQATKIGFKADKAGLFAIQCGTHTVDGGRTCRVAAQVRARQSSGRCTASRSGPAARSTILQTPIQVAEPAIIQWGIVITLR
jgi:hypothetical protein